MMTNGLNLTQAQMDEVKRMYVHRFTKQHVPGWALRPMPNGKYPKPQFETDYRWLENTHFELTKQGKMSKRPKHCFSSPTWPDGGGHRDTPLQIGE